MAEYQAKDGQEDRHGEMTGAISFNMVFVMLPLTVWCFAVGPYFFSVTWTIVLGIILAVVLTLVGVPVSRYYWAMFSTWMDREDL